MILAAAIYFGLGLWYALTLARWRTVKIDGELVAVPSSPLYRAVAGVLWLPQSALTVILYAIFGNRLLPDNHHDIDTKDPDDPRK